MLLVDFAMLDVYYSILCLLVFVDNQDENQSMMVQHKNILYLHHKILQIDSIK